MPLSPKSFEDLNQIKNITNNLVHLASDNSLLPPHAHRFPNIIHGESLLILADQLNTKKYVKKIAHH
jgi:hypothetical protein